MNNAPTRLEQIGQLLTAMIAVVLTGNCVALRNSEKPKAPKAKCGAKRGRITLQVLRHFPEHLIISEGVCSWQELDAAQRNKDGDIRIRAALRTLQILPKWIGSPRDPDNKAIAVAAIRCFGKGAK